MRSFPRTTAYLLVLAVSVTLTAAWTDGFDSLSGWTKVDPIGGGKASVSGGALNLAIPAGLDAKGRDRDDWPSASPVNRTTRVVRTVSGDWTLTTKILNTDRDAGRFAGVLVQASADHYFRSDWDGDGTHVDLYVATWDGGPKFLKRSNTDTGGAKVQWQRITKRGTAYTVATSLDGKAWKVRASFSWSPKPTSVGLNVGNSGRAPAYTARFDYITVG